jgi:hypothetical protein
MNLVTKILALSAMLPLVLVPLAATANDVTTFSLDCTGDGASKKDLEKFTCDLKMKHPKDPNTTLPKKVNSITTVFLDIGGENVEGNRCPTWIFTNGQWVRVCR